MQAMQKRVKLPLVNLNQHITCKLCNGYLIDAATITECLHTFCKSCLVRHIELVNRCPTCNTVIHETQPLYNIRLDRTMQDIVYKLLPRIEREERRRERKFYKDRQIPYPAPRACQALSVPGPSNAVKKQTASLPKKITKPKVTKHYHRTDEQISLQLETFRDGSGGPAKIQPLQKKYMRLSTQVTIGLIQRFLAAKLHLESANMDTYLKEDMSLTSVNGNGERFNSKIHQRKSLHPRGKFFWTADSPLQSGGCKILNHWAVHNERNRTISSRLAQLINTRVRRVKLLRT